MLLLLTRTVDFYSFISMHLVSEHDSAQTEFKE